MVQHNHNGNIVSPALTNSYGMEVSASEHQQQPSPQLRYDGGASAPQVVDQHPPGQTTEKQVGYAPYPETVTKTDGTGSPRRGTILGLSATLFWVIVGLVVLVVLGIALGVGLGVGLSNNNNRQNQDAQPSSTATQSQSTSSLPSTSLSSSATTSSTSTSTSSAPVTTGTVGVAANSCNFTAPKTFYIDNVGFSEYCFTDWPNNDEAFDGKGNVTDLTRTIVYTFEACMQACLDFNADLGSSDTRCTAVTYNANLTSIVAVGQQGGNCFLKDKRGINQQGSAESACAALAN